MRQETIGSADPLIALFLELARIPSPSGHERDINDFLTTRLRGLGLEVEEGEPLEEGSMGAGNLFCRVPATAPGIPILICAHTDTVASAPDALPDPVLDEGVLRSASRHVLGADDKGGVAAIVYAVERIIKENIPHAGIEVLLTVAEEGGLRGAKAWSMEGVESQCGFVFDSTGPVGHIIVRSPWQITMNAVFIGQAAHAGVAPEEGRSAVAAACKAIAGMKLGRLDEESTANIGIIKGGEAVNVVPDRCLIRCETRSHDKVKLEQQLKEMLDLINLSAAQEECDVEITIVDEFHGFDFSKNGGLPVEIAEAAIRRIGREPVLAETGGGSDVNIFNLTKVACLNLSSGMQKVHTPEEYITVEELRKIYDLVMALVIEARERTL